LTGPLAHLAEVARSLGEGRLSMRVRLRRRDEFGQVADAFDEMADRIERLVRAQRELMANVSHELRTPLARIQVALDLGQEGGAEVARESLAEISEDLRELEALVSDILTLAKLDGLDIPGSPLPPVHKQETSLTAVCEKAAAKFRVRHPTRELKTAFANLPAREVDPVLFRRALDNLLDNADKYSPADQPVVFEADSLDGTVRFQVRDYGDGISASDLPLVFDPFFRAERSRARSGAGGFGLGLSLVKSIVEAHGGLIELAPAEGGGTRATLTLPLEQMTKA
jgi:signal transduction histidine kinase